jgi:hypothetical protein
VDSENHRDNKVSTQGKADSCGKVGDVETSGKPRVSVRRASTTALGKYSHHTDSPEGSRSPSSRLVRGAQ